MTGFFRRHKKLKLISEVVIVIIIWLLIRSYVQRDAADGVAPAFSGVFIDGSVVRLESFRGKPVLLHFWATWCGVCRFEQKSIDAIAKNYQVITVAMKSGHEQMMAAYMQKEKLSFPVLADPAGSLSGLYGVRGVPASFVLDGKGYIRFVESGYTSEAGLRLRLWMAGFF